MSSPLDLGRSRGVGAHLRHSLSVWWSHRRVFLTLAALVVAPAFVLVDGTWGGKLADPGASSLSAGAASQVLFTLVVPPLVTAVHVAAVLDLARGDTPSVTGALALAGRRAPRLVAAAALYGVLVLAGLILFIIPGIWVSVACYFAAQVVALEDDAGPAGAVARSFAVVRGHWWHAFAVLVIVGVSAWVGTGAVGYPIASAASDLGGVAGGVLYVAVHVAVYTTAYSLSALTGTLLFFDLRARQATPSMAPRRRTRAARSPN